MGESQYEGEKSVDPARIQTYAGLRQRFKRGEQLRTEESRLPDLFELTSGRGRPPEASRRPTASQPASSESDLSD